ncbi:MAG TPA: hypothetical protein DCQ64_24155 [Candidatus Rokubacteria bacterium]|nr:hypothetical protein [Candidatus Rokubacteria bacterium]
MAAKRRTHFQVLQDTTRPLTATERRQVMDAKAVWHHGPKGAESPAVRKAVDPRTGETTYYSSTHRVYQQSKTQDGAIRQFHRVVKGTA